MREPARQLLGIDTYYLLSRRGVNGGAGRAEDCMQQYMAGFGSVALVCRVVRSVLAKAFWAGDVGMAAQACESVRLRLEWWESVPCWVETLLLRFWSNEAERSSTTFNFLMHYF